MKQSNLSRRSLLKGAGGMSAAAIIAAVPGARLVRAQGSADYDLIDFGPFEVEVTSGPLVGRGYVSGINEDGTVCGAIGVEEDRFSPATWSTTGKLKRLKSGKLGGQALDINDDGVVVGREFESVDDLSDSRPVVWRDGEPEELPDLNGDTAGARGSATCINNDGVIAGDVKVKTSSQAVRWIDGVAEVLPDALEGSALSVRGINENGTILASLSGQGSGLVQTFGLWRGDDVTIIEFPEEVTEEYIVLPQTLNGRDQAVFIAYNGVDDSFSFVTDGETTTLFDGREDGFSSVALDLNDSATVVGQTYEGETARAAIWEDGEAIDLNDLIAAGSGLTLSSASAINNAGMIAGVANDEEGIMHGYLLIPA